MNLLSTLFLWVFITFGIVWCHEHIRICATNCTADDEFENENSRTGAWENFMTQITDRTLYNYTIFCVQNQTQIVYIDHHSDILWDLRFKIYSEPTDKNDKTINDCYCDHTDCESIDLRSCLEEARISMSNKINTTLVGTVNDLLWELSDLC